MSAASPAVCGRALVDLSADPPPGADDRAEVDSVASRAAASASTGTRQQLEAIVPL
jgi:hypothetical protein